MSTDNNVIDVKDLSKSFDGKVVVNKISLHVKKGEVFGFLGPNGSGKTTTIRMLCGLLTPDEGYGTCLNFNIQTQSESIKQQVGYMTQKFSLYQDLTVEENLRFMGRLYNVFHLNQRIKNILDELDLFPRKDQLTHQLSGGWKQRLALAACLIHEPKLLLLDEPTAGVDPIARRTFWDRIHSLSEAGVTTLISTHYMDEAERCTRLAYLSAGQLLMTGNVNDVIRATKLHTWSIQGAVTTHTLQEIKHAPGILQAALFGNQIHVSGTDVALIEHALKTRFKDQSITWQRINTTLEDAYINLVNREVDSN